jgi:beta-lactamase superfamily II metal-dependent hydrolase
MADPLRLHLIDVGDREYGECLLVEAGGKRILIDGGHQGDDAPAGTYPGIARQLRDLTGQQKVALDLLVLSHAHSDHLGSLSDLVTDGVVEAEWALLPDPDLSWGRPIGAAPPDESDVPDTVRQAVAGLREETPAEETLIDDSRLDAFLADSVSVEERYRQLRTGLQDAGTNMVFHGQHQDDDLLASFAGIRLEILGPSDTQLALTADLMANAMDAYASDARAMADVLGDGPDVARALYQRLLGSRPDAVDAKTRPGNLVNLQSLALTMRQGSRRLFLAGDMELADPEAGNAALRAEVAALRGRMRARRPYAYAQLGHHGSANASNAGTLEDLGNPKLVGMSAGRASDKHPASSVMTAAAAAGARWVRTDRNGLVTITSKGSTKGWTVSPARGSIDDPTPAGADARTPGGGPVVAQATRVSSMPAPVIVRRSSDEVEVTIRTARPVRVTITLEDGVSSRVGDGDTRPADDSLTVGGGRALPRLLYVTDPARLGLNVGATEADTALQALRSAPGRLLEVDGSLPTSDLHQQVGAAIGQDPDLAGVVIVGGYDVIPADAIDTLPSAISAAVDRDGDADRFIVWTDDLYAQRQGAPSLPISRVPDGHRADVLFASLSAPSPRMASASGVRNSMRPFAETVYGVLTGRSPLRISEPDLVADVRGTLSGDTLYFMLHGYWRDATRLWGESGGEFPESVNLTCVDSRPGTVVFTGACWGALIVDTQAVRFVPTTPIGSRGPGESIALAYLAAGANAFVGCTGSHYSPSTPPYRTAGAPLHQSFFSYRSVGQPPAAALSQAKRDYVAAMPHSAGNAALAIEHKLVWQFACLGLGW